MPMKDGQRICSKIDDIFELGRYATLDFLNVYILNKVYDYHG